MMRVEDLMSRTVISAPAATPVVEARALMLRERIRHLLARLTVADVMTKSVI